MLLSSAHAGAAAPSPWVQRFAALLPPGASVLDLACGSGRHLRWLATQGFAVTGVDRDAAALAPLQGLGVLVTADIEAGPWPLGDQRFAGVVVTNYLWRPLFPRILGCLAPGGVLIYETFADGQQHIGRPARPEFLLQRGELLRLAEGLHVVAFEDGFEGGSAGSADISARSGTGNGSAPGDRMAAGGGRCVQRIAAVHQPDVLAPTAKLPPLLPAPTGRDSA